MQTYQFHALLLQILSFPLIKALSFAPIKHFLSQHLLMSLYIKKIPVRRSSLLPYRGVCGVVQALLCDHRGGMHFIVILVVCFTICQCCWKPEMRFILSRRHIFHTHIYIYIFKDKSLLPGSSVSWGQWELPWAVITIWWLFVIFCHKNWALHRSSWCMTFLVVADTSLALLGINFGAFYS